ncbi:hypothetical protein CkaCkLH20_10309 [Colletotrichum karsti]|uniref:Zn(2)-C6 fungal-type domain-containing protein n=1 Tax=Colletotrichum karsti TaxID=1095194 RepID=A0A9P6HVZ2_9PEZI|nr:uncharacterized protein CkaCkLH20_10309 [Colletotrichum karsti]KAF9872217.1 hypothetical protein CkaCkLH20_10309 [Colletotrichum karsti]
MAAPVTLPSMQDPHGAYGQPAYPRPYPPHPDQRGDPRGDPRASSYNASPNSVNGYPPPQPGSHQQLPSLPPPDPRSPSYPPPPDARADDYYRGRQPPPPGYGDPYYQDYHRGQGPPPQGRYPDYPPQGPGAPRYDYPPGAPRYDYGPGAPPLQQAAPRQRTSIACRYCRKRKIRCSGYQSAPGGKCVNCSRMNQECIFQPVSSSSSTAFVPVSALGPGGIPPGTPLYGAYGQPLPQGSLPPPPGQGYPPPPGNGGYYQQPLPSPTGAYSPYDSQRAGRRRPREDEVDELRPPPPDPNSADDPRRRSPASSSNHSSPGYMSYQPAGPPGYDPRAIPPARHSPGQPSAIPPPGHAAAAATQRQSNSSTPAAAPSSSVMSLNNLVDHVDRDMLGKLNRPPPRK